MDDADVESKELLPDDKIKSDTVFTVLSSCWNLNVGQSRLYPFRDVSVSVVWSSQREVSGMVRFLKGQYG